MTVPGRITHTVSSDDRKKMIPLTGCNKFDGSTSSIRRENIGIDRTI